MKIRPDQIKAYEQEQAKQKRVHGDDEEFGRLLAGEIGKSGEASKTRGAVPTPPLSGLLTGQILAAQGANRSGESAQTGREAMEKLETVLDEWENYAENLGSASTNLRQAEGTLRGIENGIAGIREKWPGLAKDNPGMNALVDEVEIMAVTERIKLNRGDYIE
ncbi:hypothetical protein GGQ74_001873 [Desulfobaculum xiamenense]|uniref:Uncharacterized protein n=1 Tax=Desulfobaculum xiamenense TaxID=995050 RepID=A0A846QME9_9BACT|nr:hypothetical protein [Desulfobaculum xiamenense]NJB68200.1 hypothetical protein [Desulfobaculum xiamenense]